MGLNGSFSPPGDKSISHRAALFSLLATGEGRFTNMSTAEDVRSSLRAVERLGVEAAEDGNVVTLRGPARSSAGEANLDCGNSGTTMRLLMGILAGLNGGFILDGDGSLRKRPMERVAGPLRLMGARIECCGGKAPITINGGSLKGIHYRLPVASAQLKSAVLLAGIQAEGTTTVVEPVPSRDHTERLLPLFRGRVAAKGNSITVERCRLYMPDSFHVPGDTSTAAFFLAAAAVIPGSDVTARGVLLNPTRTGSLNVLKRMGAFVEIEPHGDAPEPWGTVRVKYTPALTGTEVAADEVPSLIDEVPILAFVATQAEGTTFFRGVGELRVKESDRLAAISGQLGRMGATIRIEDDCLQVEGPTRLTAPARLDSLGDHRIAMTLRLAGLKAGAEPEITDEACASISYPGFRDELARLMK
jgi:3-phosphoshikimate 1-carboxyvinyltransferase